MHLKGYKKGGLGRLRVLGNLGSWTIHLNVGDSKPICQPICHPAVDICKANVHHVSLMTFANWAGKALF